MRLFKEPRNIDFSTKSEPWKEEDLAEFRVLMKELKAKNEGRLKKITPKKNRTTHTYINTLENGKH